MKATYELRDGYIYVRATGEFSETSARRVLLEWVEKGRSAALNRVVCDITRVTGFDDDLAHTMIRFNTATMVAETLPRDFMVAFLETSQQSDRDKFGENVMRNKGASVKVTLDLGEALKWLGVPQPCRMEGTATNSCAGSVT